MNTRNRLAKLNPTALKTMRDRLASQRRQELASAAKIDRVLNRVATKLDRIEMRRAA